MQLKNKYRFMFSRPPLLHFYFIFCFHRHLSFMRPYALMANKVLSKSWYLQMLKPRALCLDPKTSFKLTLPV